MIDANNVEAVDYLANHVWRRSKSLWRPKPAFVTYSISTKPISVASMCLRQSLARRIDGRKQRYQNDRSGFADQPRPQHHPGIRRQSPRQRHPHRATRGHAKNSLPHRRCAARSHAAAKEHRARPGQPHQDLVRTKNRRTPYTTRRSICRQSWRQEVDLRIAITRWSGPSKSSSVCSTRLATALT